MLLKLFVNQSHICSQVNLIRDAVSKKSLIKAVKLDATCVKRILFEGCSNANLG